MVRGWAALVACVAACVAPSTVSSPRPRAADRDRELAAARRARNLDEAEAHYRAVIARDPDDVAVAELVRLQLDRDLAADAVELAAAYYARRPEPGRAALYLDALFAVGDGRRALEVSRELTAQLPGVLADAYAARALLAAGKSEEARRQLESIVNEAPDDARPHLWLAEADSKLADAADRTKLPKLRGAAIEQAGLALERDPTLLRAYLVLVDELERGYDDTHAKLIAESLRSAVQHIRSAVPWQRMVAARMFGAREGRIAALAHVVEIEPGRGTYWTEYARELRDVDPKRAREAFARAITAHRPDASAAVPLGPLLVESGDLEAARALAAKVAAQDPKGSASHFIQGAIATRDGKRDTAIRELDLYLRASDGSGPEAQAAQRCIAELLADEPAECTWFDPKLLAARRACHAVPRLATAPRKTPRTKRPATPAERDAIAENAPKPLRVVERGTLTRPSGEQIAVSSTRMTSADDARIDVTLGDTTTRYTLHEGHAWVRNGVCRARELTADERAVVEDMAWRIPERLGARIRDRKNRVDLIDAARFAVTSPTGATVMFHMSGHDIDELVYADGAGTFTERLEDWRDGVPYRRRISIYGNEALVFEVESVDPVVDDTTFAP